MKLMPVVLPILILNLFWLGGCQTVTEKNQALVQDRIEKLKPLSTWKSTWCRVETRLTEPARARYQELFPSESARLNEEPWLYTWRASKASCDVNSVQRSEISKNHTGFLNTAFCLLLQTHFVNSPFDQLKFTDDQLHRRQVDSGVEQVQIRTGSDEKLGLFLDSKEMRLETRTKSRGTLLATYDETPMHQWLPSRLEQRSAAATIVLDNFVYNPVPVGDRLMLESFWISVGDQNVFRHTQVNVSQCQNEPFSSLRPAQ